MKMLDLLPVLAFILTVAAAPHPAMDSEPSISTPPSINDAIFQKIITDTHEALRSPHCAQHLFWDDDLAQQAQASVSKCPSGLVHDSAGTNLIGGDPKPDNYYHTSMKMIHQWYSEVVNYDYNDPVFSEATGHFTQVVWRDSSRIGCAWAQCTNGVSGASRMYCYYHNFGNIVNPGMFAQNVWPPVCGTPPSPVVPN